MLGAGDRYGRRVAEEKLLNDALVRVGMAYHYRQYSQRCPIGADSLDEAETEARGKRLGVWTLESEKPWEFRKAGR